MQINNSVVSVKSTANVKGGSVTPDSDEKAEKQIALFASTNQSLYLLGIILRLLSEQINKNSSDTGQLLSKYINLTNGSNEVSTTLNAIKVSLQGIEGVADPDSIDNDGHHTLGFANPSIYGLLNTYDDSNSRNIMKIGLKKYQEVYKWAKLLCDKHAEYLDSTTHKSVYCPTGAMPSTKSATRGSLSKRFKDLNLTDITAKASKVKKILDDVAGEKEVMQQKAQANIAASIEMQNNTSQMYGILKSAIKKLSDFGSEK